MPRAQPLRQSELPFGYFYFEYECRSWQPATKHMDNNAPGQLYFNTDALPERDRFPVYCEEIVRRYIGLDFRTQDQSRFSAKLAMQRAGLVDIMRSSSVAIDSGPHAATGPRWR